MRKSFMAAAFVALAMAGGCVTTNATPLNGAIAPDKASLEPEQIVIYRSADAIGKPYREIAILTSTGDSTFTDMSQFHKSMQERAAKVGANAVILGTTKEPSTGAEIASWVIGTPANRKSESTAIIVEGLVSPPAKAKQKK